MKAGKNTNGREASPDWYSFTFFAMDQEEFYQRSSKKVARIPQIHLQPT